MKHSKDVVLGGYIFNGHFHYFLTFYKQIFHCVFLFYYFATFFRFSIVCCNSIGLEQKTKKGFRLTWFVPTNMELEIGLISPEKYLNIQEHKMPVLVTGLVYPSF